MGSIKDDLGGCVGCLTTVPLGVLIVALAVT